MYPHIFWSVGRGQRKTGETENTDEHHFEYRTTFNLLAARFSEGTPMSASMQVV
jgi:hypothetical protein